MRTRIENLAITLATLALATGIAAASDEDRFQLGLRTGITTAKGEPANDMSTNGIMARYRLKEKWLVGAALEYAVYDFERPSKLLELFQKKGTKTVDQKVKATLLVFFVEREYRRDDSPWSFHWSGLVGAGSPDAKDVGGPLEDGGRFELTSDFGTELVAGGAAGVRRDLGEHFAVDFSLRIQRHFVDWTLTDTVSGRSTEVDDFMEYGPQLGAYFRW